MAMLGRQDVSEARTIAIVGRLGIHPMEKLSLAARRILAYLALRGDRVSRGRTSADLWPDECEDKGRANLRRALWHVPPGWVITDNTDLLLDATCDLTAARKAAARSIEGATVPLGDIELLSEDILPGWHEEWVLGAQNAFRLIRVQALETACRTMTRAGDLTLATQAGAAALAAEPLRESAAEALIDALLAQHNRHAAIQCFRTLSMRLEQELGVLPHPALAGRLTSAALNERLAS